MKLEKLIKVLTEFRDKINDDVDVLFQHKSFFTDYIRLNDLSDITIKTELIYKDNQSYNDDNVQTMNLVIQFEDDIIT